MLVLGTQNKPKRKNVKGCDMTTECVSTRKEQCVSHTHTSLFLCGFLLFHESTISAIFRFAASQLHRIPSIFTTCTSGTVYYTVQIAVYNYRTDVDNWHHSKYMHAQCWENLTTIATMFIISYQLIL